MSRVKDFDRWLRATFGIRLSSLSAPGFPLWNPDAPPAVANALDWEQGDDLNDWSISDPTDTAQAVLQASGAGTLTKQIIVGGKTYTVTADGLGTDEIAQGSTADEFAANIAAKVTTDTATTLCTGAVPFGSFVTLTANSSGSGGNAIALSTDDPNLTILQVFAGGDGLLQTTVGSTDGLIHLFLPKALPPVFGADEVRGIYKALPAGAGSITSKVSLIAAPLWLIKSGLALWEDAADYTKPLYTFEIEQASGGVNKMYLRRWTDYQTPAETLINGVVQFTNNTVILRIRRTAGGSIDFDYSYDGVGWVCVYDLESPAFVASDIGVFLDGNSNDAFDANSKVSLFRVKGSDVGLVAPLEGARVKGFYS